MVEKRKLAIPHTSIHIARLSEDTKYIIRKDLQNHARENGYILEWDSENHDYLAMAGRFCDIEEIYIGTNVIHCLPGEDKAAYEESIKRTIEIRLDDGDFKDLCNKAGQVGLKISELLENFIGDLIEGARNNGSDERMYANMWFDRCWFSLGFDHSFLIHLHEWDEFENVTKILDELLYYEQKAELDENEIEDKQILETELQEIHEEYRQENGIAEDTFNEDMKIVFDWYREVEKIKSGTRVQSEKEKCV